MVGLDGVKAEVVVAHPEDAVIREVEVADISWIRKPDAGETVTAKVRYQMLPAACELSELDERGEDNLHVQFKEQQKPTAPGQVAAFYSGDELLGGGIVSKIL